MMYQAWLDWKKDAKAGDKFTIPGTQIEAVCDGAKGDDLWITLRGEGEVRVYTYRHTSDKPTFFDRLRSLGWKDETEIGKDAEELLKLLDTEGYLTLKGELEVLQRFLTEATEGKRDSFSLYIERDKVEAEIEGEFTDVKSCRWKVNGIALGESLLKLPIDLTHTAKIWLCLKKDYKKARTDITLRAAAMSEELEKSSLIKEVPRVEATTKDFDSLKAALEAMHNGVHNGFQLRVNGLMIRAQVAERWPEQTIYKCYVNDKEIGEEAINEDLLEDKSWHIAQYNIWKSVYEAEEQIRKEKNEKLSKDSGGRAELVQGLRYNIGKNRLDLIPCSLIDGVGRVLTFGAQKYAPDNWRKFNQQQVRECIGSAMRHIEQYRQGNWLDPESGLPHLAHAATNLGFILELHKED